jgi:hypothetical protein
MSEQEADGRPRLVIAPAGGHATAGSAAAAGEETEFFLGARTTIGGASENDVVLAGLAAEHAVIEWLADGDEFVFRPVVADGTATVDGATTVTGLHHGDRLQLADWVLVFQRDEDADHVRSEGSREGGDYAGGGITSAGGHTTEAD